MTTLVYSNSGNGAPCFPAARNVEVTKHLQDVEIEEESSAVFSCELSHDDEDVEWFLNGTLLYTNNYNDIKNVGNCYTLTMKQVKPEDAGTVTMKSDKVSESACLKVIGGSDHTPPGCE